MTVNTGGTGTPIEFATPGPGVYDQYEEPTRFENCAVPLSRYAKLIGYDECAFWGVTYEGQNNLLCGTLWTEYERMTIAHALAEAQQELEQAIGYPLCPTYIVGRIEDEPDHNDRWVDAQAYSGRQLTRYSHILEVGVRATSVIASSTSVNHATDPAVIGPLATDARSVDEIEIYYPNGQRRLTPSEIHLQGGQVTIRIPRCRLVLAERWNDEEILYENAANFVGQVDVIRAYTDPSTQGVLVRPGCSNARCSGGCSDCTQAACIYPLNPLSGVVDVRRAEYVNGDWRMSTFGWYDCVRYPMVRLNYKAGLAKLNLQAEMAIVRLAHAKSPEAPCRCSHTEHLWRRDREIPTLLTAERLNNPFGLEQGAWVAYTWSRSLRQMRMGVL